MTDNEKYKVIALLQNQVIPKDIADETGVSYGAVLKLKREYEQAVMNNTLDQLINTDKLLLAKVGEEISSVVEADEAVTKLTKGLDGLERLSEDLQKTALNINTRVNSLILSIDHLSELEIAADILCKLQTSFLNKNLTQVNVQNNYGGDTPKYTQFLSDKVQD